MQRYWLCKLSWHYILACQHLLETWRLNLQQTTGVPDVPHKILVTNTTYFPLIYVKDAVHEESVQERIIPTNRIDALDAG